MIYVKSLREQVYEFLRKELTEGKLIPGSSVNLTEISEQLGISKTPLRDALIQLEAEGFVTIAPGAGSTSTPSPPMKSDISTRLSAPWRPLPSSPSSTGLTNPLPTG